MPHELKNVEIFRAGNHGAGLNMDEAMLQRIADAYDPAIQEAPVTIDHNKKGPAYGWVKSIRRNGKSLLADLHRISPTMFQAIKDGQYRKRSVELHRQRPHNLRAVTFLGAGSPLVKGMANIAFTDEAESISFGEDAEIDTEIEIEVDTKRTEITVGDFSEIIVGDWTLPFSTDGVTYDENLVGQAIAHFAPGGFGEEHRKITPGMPGYYDGKEAVVHACEQIGKDPAWAAFRDMDFMHSPAITVEALREHRPDIFAGTQFNEEGEKMPTTEELHEQIAALKADLTKAQNEFGEKNTECVEMSEKLQTLEGEKAKAERETTLKDALAEAKLPDIAKEQISNEFSERDNLEGLEARITHAKELIAFSSGKTSIDDNAGDPPSGDNARLQRARAAADKEGGPSLTDAIRNEYKGEKSYSTPRG